MASNLCSKYNTSVAQKLIFFCLKCFFHESIFPSSFITSLYSHLKRKDSATKQMSLWTVSTFLKWVEHSCHMGTVGQWEMKDTESTWSHRDGSLFQEATFQQVGWNLNSSGASTVWKNLLACWIGLLYLVFVFQFLARWACHIADMKDKLIAWVSGYHLVECIYSLSFIIHLMGEWNKQRVRTMQAWMSAFLTPGSNTFVHANEQSSVHDIYHNPEVGVVEYWMDIAF